MNFQYRSPLIVIISVFCFSIIGTPLNASSNPLKAGGDTNSQISRLEQSIEGLRAEVSKSNQLTYEALKRNADLTVGTLNFTTQEVKNSIVAMDKKVTELGAPIAATKAVLKLPYGGEEVVSKSEIQGLQMADAKGFIAENSKILTAKASGEYRPDDAGTSAQL